MARSTSECTFFETISVNGGKVRLRTVKGEPSQWRDYKAVAVHEQLCAAWFQENEALVSWVNQQPKAVVVTCLGDGHDGVWNLICPISSADQRREILDWDHLVENLCKVGGSRQRYRRLKRTCGTVA